MPRGNGMGPNGVGPMTGRAMGYCAGYDVPGYMNGGVGFGQGRGFGRGFGVGYRRGYGYGWNGAMRFDAVPREYVQRDETIALKRHAEDLEEELRTVKNRLDELQKEEKA